MSPETRKTCFVIMPFGDKINVDGRILEAIEETASGGKPIAAQLVQPIEFDKIHKYIIEKAAERLDLECIRCDEIPGAGSIHEDMFRHIWKDDVAIVDISTLNANEFYELGVRHTLHRKTTVLIQRQGTRSPFNIQGYRVITYDESDLESANNAIDEIVEFVQSGLEEADSDSPIYKHLPELQMNMGSLKPESRIIETTTFHEYRFEHNPQIPLGLVAGDIRNLKGVYVWVNSENRSMQMARYHDRSISGTIRWLGAKKKPLTGKVLENTIAMELADLMGRDTEVEAGQVIPTDAGELHKRNGVKRIFHAAAVDGQLGEGYRPFADIGRCVTNSLALIDSEGAEKQLDSIAFPLMGTGTGGRSIPETMEELVKDSVAYLANNPDTRVRRIYFLAPRVEILEAGIETMEATPGISKFDPADESGTPGDTDDESSTSSGTQRIRKLLVAMFTKDELRVFVDENYPELTNSVNFDKPLNVVAAQVAVGLEDRALLDVNMRDLLVELRPNRANEIDSAFGLAEDSND